MAGPAAMLRQVRVAAGSAWDGVADCGFVRGVRFRATCPGRLLLGPGHRSADPAGDGGRDAPPGRACIVRFWRVTAIGLRPWRAAISVIHWLTAGRWRCLLGERIRATLLLTGTATSAPGCSRSPLGIWSATRRRGWADALSRVLFTVLLIVPDLLLAIAVLVLAVETGWFPTGGMASPDAASMTAAGRVARSAAPPGAARRSPGGRYVPGAGASRSGQYDRGAGRPVCTGGPRARNPFAAAIVPPPSARGGKPARWDCSGFSLGTLLSASLLIEVVMGWPGLGPLLVDSIMARDIAVVLGAILLSAAFLIAGQFGGGPPAVPARSRGFACAEMAKRRRICCVLVFWQRSTLRCWRPACSRRTGMRSSTGNYPYAAAHEAPPGWRTAGGFRARRGARGRVSVRTRHASTRSAFS